MANETAAYSRIGRIRNGEFSTPAKLEQVKSERNLLAAILGRAILDLYGEAATDLLTVANARGWLHGPIDENKEFSFGWVAKQLDLDPYCIQAHLRECILDAEIMTKCLQRLR